MQNHSIKIIAAGFVALLLAAGCKREAIQVYQVQTEPTPPPPPVMQPAMTNSTLPPGHPDVSTMAQTPEATASPLTWKTPDGWTEVPPSEMRVASFKVNQGGKMVDVSVIPLGPMAGTDSANVNRWRGQIGLALTTDDEIQKSAENVEAAGQPAQLYDVTGTNPESGDKTRIIGVIQHRDDATWFCKMTGDADLVEAQKPAFIEFLKSLKLTGATAQTEMPATLPPGHPAIGAMPSAPATGPISHDGQPDWQVPSDWQEVPAAQFLLAEYAITGANGAKAEVNAAQLSGDGGGLAPNINRWRGQLGLSPDPNALTTSLTVTGGTASLVDINGTNGQTGQPARLIGVIVSQADRTWFYKLMGDPGVVESQKNAFVKFVQSAKY